MKYLQLLRRVCLLLLPLILGASFLVLVASALAGPRVGSLMRVTWASNSATRDSRLTSLSDGGRIVAFYSDSDLLNEGRPDQVYEIWLYDTASLTFTRVTSASHANRDSESPSLSGDGTVVAFRSDSDFLNEGIADEQYEIWLYDTTTMSYTRITSASHTDRDSEAPSLNRDGTVVAFRSNSDLLGDGFPDGRYEIWLYNTATMTYTRVSLTLESTGQTRYPSLSDDGTVVAFGSDAYQPGGWDIGRYEIWLYDTAAMAYTWVTSVTNDDRGSSWPSLSGDGTVVAFMSHSDFLNEGRPLGVYEIWLYDTATMTYTRVTSASDVSRDSLFPSLNWDGTVVAFRSDSDFLSEGIADEQYEIWLCDTATMAYTRITLASHDFRVSWNPSLNRDGTVVAFHSDSDFLNEGIALGQDEVWLWKPFRVYLPLVLRYF